ncbi:PcF and SCR74-like cys-rich secreted peptide, putative [Phytophthora infestans T30-4]|uniref:PcF and SCR74-like cys-rich secreted peptide, putative n=1 Tax=Phytophthora infestans (strain T30-4) TaxID=403677 RepID=D0NDE4_PHYIT|nr:PcF and SCR74-like cys-rich secreted peptide, putative [Phytophthora infestans T30-4]EEY56101.1 PcF and SCR74-like cys-rich secreted peptide, putative [Phytophthora infestans T30-4]|eukprot:XP_002902931.1 PcF and SCR74-like cys-rich secreted peptide, putative [Phytophthora infestans T30-4]
MFTTYVSFLLYSFLGTVDDSEEHKFIPLFLKSSSRRYLARLLKMNVKTYVFLCVAAVFATLSSAQPFCTAKGCALNIYSPANIETSECCRKQPGSFDSCCSKSCNEGFPCK